VIIENLSSHPDVVDVAVVDVHDVHVSANADDIVFCCWKKNAFDIVFVDIKNLKSQCIYCIHILKKKLINMTSPPPPSSVHVVIAHYNEDLAWTKELDFPYTIVSRHGIPRETPPNRGNEASAYLEYIISHYDEGLPDVTFFVHGHETSDHHVGKVQDLIREHVRRSPNFPQLPYHNINLGGVYHLSFYPESFVKFAAAIPQIADILQDPSLKPDSILEWYYRTSAQFYVQRSAILRNPKWKYEALYNYLMTTDEESSWTGRYLEYLWHYLFTGSTIDT
jgi:hypothetical protein